MGSDRKIEMIIVSEEIIKPSSPTPESLREYKFSFLDQIVVTCYIPAIFFYQNPSFSSSSTVVDHLKKSLSNTLSKFYTFAGRIKGNSYLLCDDSGALFIEARVHSQLSHQALQNGTVFQNLNPYLGIEPYADCDASSMDERRNIPLIVKVSLFDCGGVAIGVCMSHKLGDLATIINFMNIWGALHRGDAKTGNLNLYLGYKYFPPLENIPQSYMGPINNLVMKRFVFDKEKIAEIKKLMTSSNISNPTRVESVSTFIWKHIVDVVKSKKSSKTKIFVLSHAVNLRPRISINNSPDPNTIIGANFSVVSHGVSSEEEMKFEDLAKVVRNCIRKIDHELPMIIENGSVYYYNILGEAMGFFSKPDLGLCFFSSWCNFPVYEVDYGWGKPVSVGTVAMPIKNGVNLMDTRDGEGIEAWITMSEDEMAMLPHELLSLQNSHLHP